MDNWRGLVAATLFFTAFISTVFSQEKGAGTSLSTRTHAPTEIRLPHKIYKPVLISACECIRGTEGPQANWDCSIHKGQAFYIGPANSASVARAHINTTFEHRDASGPNTKSSNFKVGTPDLSPGDIVPLFGFPFKLSSIDKDGEGVRSRGSAWFKLVEDKNISSAKLLNQLAVPNGGWLSRSTNDIRTNYSISDIHIHVVKDVLTVEYEARSTLWDAALEKAEDFLRVQGIAQEGASIKSPAIYMRQRNGSVVKERDSDVFRVTHIQKPEPTKQVVGWVVLELIHQGESR